ncbi:MAG: hypothetical protein HC810_05545 [Acaryochloridaceae cyanobacterium RL_2_7]|nr:hypothetical protein [Acaryochloridaceae cyanobacterium RL_2_7]
MNIAKSLWVGSKKRPIFSNCQPPPIPIVQFPSQPQVEIKSKPEKAPVTSKKLEEDAAPVAIGAGLGWLMGGPIGAAVIGGASYVLTQTSEKLIAVSSTDQGEDHSVEVDLAYAEAAEQYLNGLSQSVLKAIALYRTQTHDLLHPKIQRDLTPKQTAQSAQLALLESIRQSLDPEDGSKNIRTGELMRECFKN